MRNLFHDQDAQLLSILDQRFYSNDMVNFWPSSTTILDSYPKGDWYARWLKDNGRDADRIRDEAADKGSAVHSATEAIDNGFEVTWATEDGKVIYKLEEWQQILNYVDFLQKVKPKIIANERVMCSDDMGYGGTLDRVMEFGGKRWIVDIKTSNQIAETYVMQTASYAKLWNEKNPNCLVDDHCVLWLKSSVRTEKLDDKKGVWQGRADNNTKSWQIVTFDEHYDQAFKDFLHVQAIWMRSNPNYRPLNMIFPDRIKIPKVIPA